MLTYGYALTTQRLWSDHRLQQTDSDRRWGCVMSAVWEMLFGNDPRPPSCRMFLVAGVIILAFPIAGLCGTRILSYGGDPGDLSDVTEESPWWPLEDPTFQIGLFEAAGGLSGATYREMVTEAPVAPNVISPADVAEVAAPGNESLEVAPAAEPPQSILERIFSAVIGFASAATSQR
jgi:hypothetical protein